MQIEAINKKERLWNVIETAEFLNISPGTLYHWLSQNRIPCIRFSARCLRFDPEKTKKWAAEFKQS
jgi:excisionase family DNA binding protein